MRSGRKKPAALELDRIDQASIPMFVLTMLGEWWLLRNRPKRTLGDMYDATPEQLAGTQQPPDPLVPLGYEQRDTAASLTMLLGNITVNFLLYNALGKVDGFLFKHRVSSVGQRRGRFLTSMVLWDFLYYWDHRWMHEVRLMWANHVTHHSSERYNLSTALRQPWSPYLTHWVFSPLPLLGFDAKTVHRAGQLNLLYQYWIHTEVIDRLHPVAERVLNTPSHHRAHHGANPQYLDKNYGGILIVWDKLFGTFEPEVRRIKYGLTKNIGTYNPIRIGYHELVDIVRDVRGATRWRDKLGYVFAHPGWKPAPQQAVAA
jgi:sterol desaturase/sphingolipid hydroxylase (fatty acid hydroxylase superfamily)